MENKLKYKTTEKFTTEKIQAILKVEKELGLTADNLVKEASHKNSPLHDLFTWDNSKAASMWRLQQARFIINEVKVIIEEKEYYAFENVQVKISNNDNDTKREYKTFVEILSDEELRKQYLQTALNKLQYWQIQYQNYSELKPIFQSIERVKRRIEKEWQKKKK